jgi:hypothetical protein
MGKISPGTHEVPLALGVDIGASAEVIILGGNVAAAGDQLFAPLRMEVAERTSPMLGREVPIVQQSTIGFGRCCRSGSSCLSPSAIAENMRRRLRHACRLLSCSR